MHSVCGAVILTCCTHQLTRTRMHAHARTQEAITDLFYTKLFQDSFSAADWWHDPLAGPAVSWVVLCCVVLCCVVLCCV